MDRVDEILFLYEDDRVEMANGGDLRSRPGGGFAGKSREEIKEIMAKRSMPGKRC